MNIPTPEDKTKATNILIDIIADDEQKENHDAAFALIDLLNDDGNDGTCPNHVANSWGACENCGRLVF